MQKLSKRSKDLEKIEECIYILDNSWLDENGNKLNQLNIEVMW